jgi:glycosyltransferase involved in cell wall biosynthesis
MVKGQKVVVVMPAYNAESTLEQTYREIPLDVVDEVVMVDDGSRDQTVQAAHRLGISHIIEHEANRGYGANQKTCYRTALGLGADIVIMLHPDYQYTPNLIPAMADIIASGLYPVVLGSRILGNGALKGGMPYYKYVANRFLTFVQNALIGQKLSEYHTGYRAFSRTILETVNFEANHNGFVFDNEMLSQILYAGYEIAEITCPTKYFPEASSTGFWSSVEYGFGVLWVCIRHLLQRTRLADSPIYHRRLRAQS